MTALMQIQESKGKWYSEVMQKFYRTGVGERTKKHLDGLVMEILRMRPSRADLGTATRRICHTEFQGTTYMPLPDEAAIIRILREVQGESAGRRIGTEPPAWEPPPFDMSAYEGMSDDETFEALLALARLKFGF
ncbi:hypothetical protein [Pelodictyon luteolum]|uniref:hypothetical protein n=1 Tax=Pelodictyon luteolum TaxID=1100 RepID=UPI0002E82665|nr:hypothetical protein [Pelodictyon luteolum]